MGKYVFERPFHSNVQKNVILAPLIHCHDPGRTVSSESTMHSGSFNKAEQFSINVSFNTFYSIFEHTSPIKPTLTNCDISDNNSLLKCVIADVTEK